MIEGATEVPERCERDSLAKASGTALSGKKLPRRQQNASLFRVMVVARFKSKSGKEGKMCGRRRAAIRGAFLVAVTLLIGCDGNSDLAPSSRQPLLGWGGYYGLYNTENFQNNWQGSLWYNNDTTNKFGQQHSYYGTQVFHWGLGGSQLYIEEPYDQYTSDAVDVLWLATHGWATSTDAEWMMWDVESVAQSSYMRLGDEDRGLKLLISYACHTLQADPDTFARWDNVFAGGLKYVVGFHDMMYYWETTDDVGWQFSVNMRNEWNVRDAWRDATGDWLVDNDPAVLTTGTDAANCGDRRHNSNLNEILVSYYMPVLRDSQINYYCWTTWNDV